MKIKLSAPKQLTWWIAVIVGALGILKYYGVFSIGGIDAFLFVMIGFLILAIATAVKGL